MTIANALLAEFEQECVTTKKFLSRIPTDKLEWRPHEKSMTAGQLALHMAMSPGRVAGMAVQDSVPMPDFQAPNPQPGSLDEVLTTFEESIAAVRKTLGSLDDGGMQGTWRVVAGDTEIMQMPRAGVFRVILLNHMYHHRGQLGVYLRLLGASVPSAYGPSGDELPDFLANVDLAAIS